VTLGGVSLNKGKRHPTLEDNVVVGAGAKVLGAITVGAGSRIGANAVVNKPVPPDSVVVGVPGQVVMRSIHHADSLDFDHNQLPDTIGASLVAVMSRLERIEANLNLNSREKPVLVPTGHDPEKASDAHTVHPPDHGMWHGEDFMI
jgi:serine O-acetyltransferase